MARCRGVLSLYCSVVVISLTLAAGAQTQGDSGDPSFTQGLKPYGSYHGGDIDIVSLENGKLDLHIPLLSYPQRGDLQMSFTVRYNNPVLNITQIPQGCTDPHVACNYFDYYGSGSPYLPVGVSITADSVSYEMSQGTACGGSCTYNIINTPDGGTHILGNTSGSNWRALDASGWAFSGPIATGVATDPNGTRYIFAGGYPSTIEDRNGNQITTSSSGYTDSLGRTIPFLPIYGHSGTAGNPSLCPSGLLPIAAAYAWTVPSVATAPGGTATYTLCYASVPYSFTLQYESGGTNYPANGNAGMLQSIVLPNGQSWSFAYDTYLNLDQITLPTGGTITYTWSVNVVCSQGDTFPRNFSARVTSRTVNANDGTGPHGWGYGTGPAAAAGATVTGSVTDPAGNQDIYTLTPMASTSCALFETQVRKYQGSSASGTLLQTTTTAYYSSGDPYYNPPSASNPINVVPTSITTAWANGQTKQVQKTYDSGFGFNYATAPGLYGKVMSESDSDYGSGGAGATLRRTVYNYQAFVSPNYLTYNFLDPVYSEAVYDSNANQCKGVANVYCAYTYYGYDESSLKSSGIGTQHDSSPVNGSYRGNQTSVRKWLNGSTVSQGPCTVSVSNGYVVSNKVFFDTGEVQQSSDPCGYATSFLYSSTYAGALPTTVTNPLSQSTVNTYDFNTGLLLSTTDPNQQQTNYTYDSSWRTTQVNYPDGGLTKYSYNDSIPAGVTVTKAITSSVNLVKTAVLDGLARVSQTQLVDPDCHTSSGLVYVNYGYGYNTSGTTGAYTTVSNPYCQTSDSTYGVTTKNEDGLGRVASVLEADGSQILTTYSGNCTTVTDETGNARQSCVDGLGRMTSVQEPGINGIQTSATATITISGTLESYGQATSGTGNVSISGTLQCTNYCPGHGAQCQEVGDSGNVSITVNNVQETTSYSGACSTGGTQTSGSTPTSIAQALAGLLTSSSAGVTATTNGSTVLIAANATGSNTDYSLSASSGSTSTYFPTGSTSFPVGPSGPTLTGGTNGTPTYDSGTVSATINTCTATVSYTQSINSTSTAIASALASALSSTCSSLVSATASGSTITITTVASGNGPTISATSTSNNPTHFSPPSFSASATPFGGGEGGGLSNPLVTNYSYDTLSNLTCAVQQGTNPGTFSTCAAAPASWRPRSFVYDSLSHLTSATNPESGTISYAYDADGNVATKIAPKANQTGTATIQTSYTYDKLNRLSKKAYNDGSTATAQYGYDAVALTGCTTAPPGVTDNYPIGRRTAMCDGSGGTSWAHDKVGRVLSARRTIGAVVGDYETDTYNLDGSPTGVTSLGYSVGYVYSKAERPLSAINYSGGTTNFVTSATYAPPGELATMTMGFTSTFGGIVTSNAYNSRLQPILLSAGVTGQSPVFSECFDFHLGVALNTGPCSFTASKLGDNGNVYQMVNNRDNTRSQFFSYDFLNRITGGQSVGSQWGETFTIDAWSNLTNRTGIAGQTYFEPLSVSAGNSNQLSGFGYDAAGNMTSNGGATYVYDGENRLIATGGYSYIYDGEGQRVEKCAEGTPGACASGATGTLYWRGITSDPLSETDLSGNVQNTYIFFNGRRIARRDSAGAIHYYFSDHLGTHGVVENATATACEQDIDYYPYGGVQKDYCPNVAQNYKFNGKERDSESGLDNFGARYDTSNLGRFMTPDWAAKPVTVPYAHFGNPQSLNLYSYVQNNPTTMGDPDGHVAGADDLIEGAVVGFTIAVMATQAYYAMPPEQRNFGAALSGAASSVSSTFRSWVQSSDNSKSESKPPNPNGSKGAPDHQQTADEEAAKMGGDREVRVQTPGGEKGSRVIDAAKVENGRVTEATQVVRPNKDGTAPAREVRAAADIQKATGVQPKLVPVRPCTTNNSGGCSK
jgi:RHS repeat-associated protein